MPNGELSIDNFGIRTYIECSKSGGFPAYQGEKNMYTVENLIGTEDKRALGKAMMNFIIGIMNRAGSADNAPSAAEIEILPQMIDRLLR